jgi:hypothetical protein
MCKSGSKNSRSYWISLAILLLASAYPVFMGVKVMAALIREGQIDAAAYPKYIIPYTPVCLAVITAVSMLPLASRIFKRLSLSLLSALGAGMFLLFETLFEQITVFSQQTAVGNIGSWQAYLCIATPEVQRTIEYRRTIGQDLAQRYNPAFKAHFYLISILIVLAVIGVIHGFYKMEANGKRRPLILQACVTAIFIGLCVFACFTAFYRTGDINISPLSSWLMSVFFVVFGVTGGACAGVALLGKKPLLSQWVPAAAAIATTIAMYIGELVLMGGVLFKFGKGLFFSPMGSSPFAPADALVIVASGVLTWLLTLLMRVGKPKV